MLTRLLTPLFSLAIFASVSQSLVIRQTEPAVGDWCAGLGGNTIDNLGNFTLAAFNPAGNNANDTGNPLVLSSTGSTAGFSTATFATWASYPFNDWPSFTMTNGGIKANGPVRSVATSATDGSPVLFITTNVLPERDPAQIFCAVPSNDVSGQHPHPYLAVHQHYDKWSLCPKVFRPDLQTWKVVYDVTPGVPSNDYSVDKCFSVLLNIVV